MLELCVMRRLTKSGGVPLDRLLDGAGLNGRVAGSKVQNSCYIVSKIGPLRTAIQLGNGWLTEGVNLGQRGGSHQGGGGSESKDDGTEGLHFDCFV